jgi:hypothetical protein
MKRINNQIITIFFIGIFSLFFFLSFVSADEIRAPTGNEIVPLVRVDNLGVLMSPDTTYTLYYIADGKPVIIKYTESFASYFFGKKNNEKSLIAMSIYYAPWFDQKYTLVKNTGIDLFTQKTSLPQTNGVYKFEFKCYGHNWAAVNFKIY